MASWEPWAFALLKGGIRGIPLQPAAIHKVIAVLEAEQVARNTAGTLQTLSGRGAPQDPALAAEVEEAARQAWTGLPPETQKELRRSAKLLSLEDDQTERSELARDLADRLTRALLAHSEFGARLAALSRVGPKKQGGEPPIDGRFTPLEVLGEGAFGIAWKAQDHDGSLAVVKLLHPRLTKSAKHTERFRREIVALAKLRHPHIVGLVAQGTCQRRGQPYYAMRWCEGKPLSVVLKEAGDRLPQERALRLTDQLLDAMEYTHAQGILHRDLKPDNALVERPGTAQESVVVLDFGLAKHATGGSQTIADLTGKNLIGTPVYMSPEQCSGMKVGPATDIYAVGCMLFRILAGRPPFEANSAMALISHHVMEEPPSLEEYCPEAPQALIDLVAACLEKEAEDRPTATDLRRMLADILDDPDNAEIDARFTLRNMPAPSGGITGAVTGGVRRFDPERAVGSTLGGHRLERLLGAGGFGAVFLTHLPTGQPAAVKVLLPRQEDDPLQGERRFQREAHLLSHLVHPAIPKLYGSGVERGARFAVLELIEGQDLQHILQARGHLPLPELLAILRQILPALDFIHCRGVVHCDLKPENIRLRTDGRAFLLDLGIAKLREGSQLGGRSIVTMDGAVIGTFQYLPPEFNQGRRQPTPAADVYSMGVLIYQALSGHLPFKAADPATLMRLHATASPPPLERVAPDVPGTVAEVVMRCLEKLPQDRYPTAGFLLQALEQAVLTSTPSAAAPGGGAQPTGPQERNRSDQAFAPTAAVPVPGFNPELTLQPDYASPGPGQDDAFPATILPGGRAAPALELALGIVNGGCAGQVVLLEPTRASVTIGRDPGVDIRLAPHDAAVSRVHATIQCRGGRFFIEDAGSSGGTFVEGAQAGAAGLPLIPGVTIRLGHPGLFLLVDEPARLEERCRVLRRVDHEMPPVALDGTKVIGRAEEAALQLDARADLGVSGNHCRLTPVLGVVFLEDLESANGTFVDGRRVSATLLRPGDEITLGHAQTGPRFVIEEAREPSDTKPLGHALVPLPEGGDAMRVKLEVELDGMIGRLFLFAGPRVRFGRNRKHPERGRQNDLLLRAFPRGNEARSLVKQRTNSVSGHHGCFVVTQNGVAIRDDGSTMGTDLDGKTIPAQQLTPLEDEFILDVAEAIGLRGRVFRSKVDLGGAPGLGLEADHPVAAVRLERTRDGEHHSYVLLLRELSIGSGPEDALSLPHESVRPGHARLALRDNRFLLSAQREDAPVTLSGVGKVASGTYVPLGPGAEVQVGEVRLRFSLATDDDMIPPKR